MRTAAKHQTLHIIQEDELSILRRQVRQQLTRGDVELPRGKAFMCQVKCVSPSKL